MIHPHLSFSGRASSPDPSRVVVFQACRAEADVTLSGKG